jgi:hypothetical protein
MERGDYDRAMGRWVSFADRHPGLIEPYLGCIDAAFRCGDPVCATLLIEKAPQHLASDTSFKCRVQLQFCRRWSDMARGLAIVNEVDHSTIDRLSAISVCQFLYDAALFDELENLAASFIQRFPFDRQLIAHYLKATRLSRGAAQFEIEKARVLSTWPASEVPSILAWFEPPWLTTEEAKRVIDWTIGSRRSDPKKMAQLVAIAFHPAPDVLGYLSHRLGSEGDVAFRVFGRLLLAAVRDQRRIALADLGGVSWAEFEHESASMRDDIVCLLGAPEAGRLPKRFRDAVASLDRARQRFHTAWIATGESYYETGSLAVWLANRVAAGTPTSMIRLGDGEGNFLPYRPEEAIFQAEDQRQIQEVWWGAAVSATEAAKLGPLLIAAIMRADAVGVPPLKRLLKDLNNPLDAHTANTRGICSAIQFVERLPAPEAGRKILLSLHINADLDRWDLYRQILAPATSVSVVSCLDLSRLLADRFGVSVRRWWRVPPEHRYRALLAEAGYELGRPFYPDLFEVLMAEVDPLPGELYLVAAGFLGKILCDKIRERGGIGLDIGSVADSWMGRATRFHSGASLEFDPASSLIEGHPFTDRFNVRSISDAEPCRSDRSRRVNLTNRFDTMFETPATRMLERSRTLRIIGHPRCGSLYVALVLSRLGLQIGHERPGANGICSWIHTVEDGNPPFDTPWLQLSAFSGTIAYVRAPIAAIPSIMLENTSAASFAFRRFHIARILGVDIASRPDPFERAIESYLCWTEIVERQRPLFTTRVEHLIDDVVANASTFETLQMPIDLRALAEAATIPRSINSSSEKFAVGKPEVDVGRYAALPVPLRNRLNQFCERYGYSPQGEHFTRTPPRLTFEALNPQRMHPCIQNVS